MTATTLSVMTVEKPLDFADRDPPTPQLSTLLTAPCTPVQP